MKLTFAASIAFLSLIVTGCLPMNHSNSTSQDALVYGPVSLPVATGSNAQNNQLYVAAQTIIQQNCVTCHSNFSNQTQAEWIASLYIVPGSPQNSELFGHIKGSNVGGAEDMPQGGQLSAADVTTIRQWITSITTATTTTGGSTNTAATRSAAAQAVIAVNCASCHTVTRTATSSDYSGATVPTFASFNTDSQYVQSGMIYPEFPTNSWIYRALKVHGDIATMPETGSPLSDTDAQTIYNWILDIDNP
jgi:mono/diheme cytochrome c family protein